MATMNTQWTHDLLQGMEDCKLGIYDKWYRYNRPDDGDAYDKGWVAQNARTQNEEVRFLESTNA